MTRLLSPLAILVLALGCRSAPPLGGDAGSSDGSTMSDGASPDGASLDGPSSDACVASCGGRECGDDGCGGECGPCGPRETCAAGVCEAMPTTCPPTGPFGTAVGDAVPDVTLMDCDGAEHSLHELCDHEALWVFEFAQWCPPCRAFAPDVNRIYERFQDRDLAAYFVFTETDSFGPPTAADCAAVRDAYGLTMPVLYDPSGAFPAALGVATNAYNVILTRGGVIDWEGHYAESQVEGQLERLLGP